MVLGAAILVALSGNIARCADVAEMCIESPQPSYGKEEPVRLRIKYVNKGSGRIVLWMSRFAYNHKIEIIDGKGVKPSITEDYKKILESSSVQAGERLGRNVPIALMPGDVYAETGDLDLRKLYVLPPGSYTMDIVYQDDQCEGLSGAIKSNRITITIEDKPKTSHPNP